MVKLTPKCELKSVLPELLNNSSDFKLHSWKLVGQEQNSKLIVSWIEEYVHPPTYVNTCIGSYHPDDGTFQTLATIKSSVNIIQATLNSSGTILLYVIKESSGEDVTAETNDFRYKLSIVPTKCKETEGDAFTLDDSHQIMAQFLYKAKPTLGDDRFLVFTHQKHVKLYLLTFTAEESEKIPPELKIDLVDTVIKSFSWAQWDSIHQSLFYIHFKQPVPRADEEEQCEAPKQSSTLSALQFNENTPHETVLNIPLNLPTPILENSCNTYDDIAIPLKVHDCSLNVTVLSDQRGAVCICHHYIYQPVKDPLSGENVESSTVYYAYSVTLLHHGQVIHCTIPGIPWAFASEIKPIFMLHRDDYMIVYMPGLLVHLLDMSLNHESCCHIAIPHENATLDSLITIYRKGNWNVVNLKTLEVFNIDICPKILAQTYFDRQLGLLNKLSIIHYFLVHKYDFDIICELLKTIAQDCLNDQVPAIFHEVLISGAYASVHKSLPDGIKLMRFLPLSSVNPLSTMEFKVNGRVITLTQEALWNPAVMLLSPRQRLCLHRTDLWTKLWDLIANVSGISRFKPTTVAEKLTISLICYQPEALSRCSTPLSPGSGLAMNTTLAEMSSAGNCRVKPVLPFYEVEKCTASKQEHVISVNLRELSIHLVKHGLENPLQVHVVATRYAAAQLEMSRFLCSVVTNSSGVSAQLVKGFQLVSDLPRAKRKILFLTMERYVVAVDNLAYPTPQGFSSFFTFLAYATLPFGKFVQYVQANALQLQIDVMKRILMDIEDDPPGVKKKLRLLLLLPRSRARRLLNQWPHPVSLMLRGREHAINILSGVESRTHNQKPMSNVSGLSSFQSADRYSPLDTFLDLLTAKASLAELDFNLLVEATISSVEKSQ